MDTGQGQTFNSPVGSLTAAILAFNSMLCLLLSRWRVVQRKRKTRKVEEKKKITTFLNRCCCLFLTAGHGYNCVCFHFSQHSLSRGRTTLFPFFFYICVVYSDTNTVWTAVRTGCMKNNTEINIDSKGH